MRYQMVLRGQLVSSTFAGAVPKWLREGSAKPSFSGSNPLGASILFAEYGEPVEPALADIATTSAFIPLNGPFSGYPVT